jgi:iron complex outermembrane receptor protein
VVTRLKMKTLLASTLMVAGPVVGVAFAADSTEVKNVAAGTALAGDTTNSTEQSTGQSTAQDAELIEAVVLGSRRSQRTVAEAAVPVDVISSSELVHQGDRNLLDVLASSAPSFNVSREAISDAATMVRPFSLRGLPSDSTLVLVNGKRQHRGAVIGEFVAGVQRGAQGVDLYALPGIALARVELLRDGSSAQYGSDAIAGVINLVLADRPTARAVDLQWGRYYRGDGAIANIGAQLGFALGAEGGLTLSAEWRDARPTSRGLQDPAAAALTAAGVPGVPNPAAVWGNPRGNDDYKLVANGHVAVGSAEAYLFGNYASRAVDGSFFYRNPIGRSGVYTNDGGQTLLVGDLTPTDGVACPVVPIVGGKPEATGLAALTNNPACFAFNERYPGGFTPRFGGTVEDYSAVAGVRGELANGWRYDLSGSIGQNGIQLGIHNTVNASMGPNSPADFQLGQQVQREELLNLDLHHSLEIGWQGPLSVAFGLQQHNESFRIVAGEPASYTRGPLALQGFSAGSNGFQGFAPDTAGITRRRSHGVYLDLEGNPTETLLVAAAVRGEKFSDFGQAFTAKGSGRFEFMPGWAVRGSVGTGFRAPTVGQTALRRTSTSFAGGQLVENLVLPPTNPVASLLGGSPLQPERSRHLGFGLVGEMGAATLTLDAFRIAIRDRLALTQRIVGAAERAVLLQQGIADAATISSVQFFANEVDTTTRGVDLVVNLPLRNRLGKSSLTLAQNFTSTRVTRRGSALTPLLALEIERAEPRQRTTLTAVQSAGDFSFTLRANHYGRYTELLFTDESLLFESPSATVVDAEISYAAPRGVNVVLGAKNLFNRYPAENPFGRQPGFLGAIYPLTSPFGYNGGFAYLRLEWSPRR